MATPGNEEKVRPLITLACPRDLANRLRVVAAHRELTMTDALDKYLRPVLDREYVRILEEADREIGGEG